MRYKHDIVEQVFNCKVKKSKFLGGGTFGRVFKITLENELIIAVKYYTKNNLSETEAKTLDILSQYTTVKMPKVYFYNDNVMIMEFLNGQNLLHPKFIFRSKEKKKALAKEIINGILGWENIVCDKYGYLNNPQYNTWAECFEELKLKPAVSYMDELYARGKFNKKHYALINLAIKKYKSISKEPNKAVLCHGDINIMNVMVEPKSLKLVGFIDPYQPIYADYAYGLYPLQNMWGNLYYLHKTYKELTNDKDENLDFKVVFYGLINEIMFIPKSGIDFPPWYQLWVRRLKKLLK